MGEWRYISNVLDYGLDGCELSASPPPQTRYRGERGPKTHLIGDWMGSRAGLDAVE
jgi:hypothetical protein